MPRVMELSGGWFGMGYEVPIEYSLSFGYILMAILVVVLIYYCVKNIDFFYYVVMSMLVSAVIYQVYAIYFDVVRLMMQ